MANHVDFAEAAGNKGKNGAVPPPPQHYQHTTSERNLSTEKLGFPGDSPFCAKKDGTVCGLSHLAKWAGQWYLIGTKR